MKGWIALGVFVLTAAPAFAQTQSSAADEAALRGNLLRLLRVSPKSIRQDLVIIAIRETLRGIDHHTVTDVEGGNCVR
jgi:hypothetical protein